MLAGIYIAFGAAVSTAVLSGGALDAGLARFLAGSVFSVGLILALILGSELFTGNIIGGLLIVLLHSKLAIALLPAVNNSLQTKLSPETR